MNRTNHAPARVQPALVATIGAAFLAVALGQGGYATTAIACGAVAVWVVVGLGLILRIWPGWDIPKLGVFAVACLAGLAALSASSAAWADDAGRAFSAALLPAFYAGFLALVLLCRGAIRPNSWLAGLAVGATLTGAVALVSRLDPGIVDDGGALTSIGAQGRLSFPIGYWNGLAACIAIGLLLLVWLSAESASRRWRAIAIAMIPVGGTALFFTSSRGGVIATVLGVAVLAAFGRNRAQILAGAALGGVATVALALLATGRYDLMHDLGTSVQRTQGLELAAFMVALGGAIGWIRWRLDGWLATLSPSRRVTRLGLLGVAVTTIVLVVSINPATVVTDLSRESPTPTSETGQRGLFDTGASGRTEFWGAALAALASHPLGGVGAANFELYWNAHATAESPAGNAHSLFLEELADLGPLGLFLAIGPFAAAIIAARRLRGRLPPEFPVALALLATGAIGVAIDWTWRIPACLIPLLIAVGLLTGGTAASAQARDSSAPPAARSRGRFGLGVATMLFAWAVICVGGIVVYTSLRLGESRDAVARGDLAGAAEDARAAASVEPFSPEPQIQLALVYARAGDLRGAREAAGRAMSNAPGDWRGWMIAGEIDQYRGRGSSAFTELATAASLTPSAKPPRIPLLVPKPDAVDRERRKS